MIDWNAVRFLPNTPPSKPNIAEIQTVVCARKGLTREELRSPSRTRRLTRPRQVAMALCREMTGKSYPVIAREFGGRDHTTVLFAYRKIKRAARENPALEIELDRYREAIIAQVEARATVQ